MFYTSAHVQECKDRKNRWRGVLKYKDPETGRWRERKRTFTGVESKRDAIAELGRWRAEMEDEANRREAAVQPPGDTVYRAIADLLELQLSLHRISIVTFQNMTRSNEVVIKPRLGQREFSEVTRDDVQGFVNELTCFYAPASVRAHFAVVSKTYKDALRRGRIVRDPTDGVVLPKLTRGQVNFLDEVGRPVFREKMSVKNPYYLPATIAYHTGMRAGEICALQWRDVSFDDHVVKVRRTAVYCEGPEGGSVLISVPKTPKSRRTIPLSRQLEQVLRLERAGLCKKGSGAGRGDGGFGRVGSAVDAEEYVIEQRNPKVLCSGFLKWSARNGVIGAAGKPISMHGLRHTFATLGVQSGMDIKSLSSMLGHASALMTLDIYAGDDEHAKRLAMDTFSEFLQADIGV